MGATVDKGDGDLVVVARAVWPLNYPVVASETRPGTAKVWSSEMLDKIFKLRWLFGKLTRAVFG